VDNRYNRHHIINNVTFYLDSYSLDLQECKYLLFKLVEQTVRDYCLLEYSDVPYRVFYWNTAKDFLFEEDYFIAWGDLELNLDQIGDIIGVDSDYIRRKAKERYIRDADKREKKRLRKENK